MQTEFYEFLVAKPPQGAYNLGTGFQMERLTLETESPVVD